MMIRHLPWLALLMSIVIISWSALRWFDAHRLELASRISLVQVSDTVGRIQQSLSQQPNTIYDGEPSPGLSGQITDSLAAAGLPPTSLVTFQADADQAAENGTSIRRRSARLTLSNITLAQFGRFLSIWRSRRPEWTPVAITISPQPLDSKESGREYRTIQAPLTIQLTIECRFLPKPAVQPATLMP